MSRARQTRARSRVRLWRWSPCSSRRAAAAPSACRRCSSGRRPPRSSPERSLPSACFDQDHAARRRAGHERRSRAPDREPADIDRMEAVDVLVGVDRLDAPACVDVLRQRQLHEDAVDRGIGVEPRRSAPAVRPRWSRPAACAAPNGSRIPPPCRLLLRDIDLARRVLADEHHREAGLDAEFRHQPVARLLDLLDHRSRGTLFPSISRASGVASMPTTPISLAAVLAVRGRGGKTAP